MTKASLGRRNGKVPPSRTPPSIEDSVSLFNFYISMLIFFFFCLFSRTMSMNQMTLKSRFSVTGVPLTLLLPISNITSRSQMMETTLPLLGHHLLKQVLSGFIPPTMMTATPALMFMSARHRRRKRGTIDPKPVTFMTRKRNLFCPRRIYIASFLHLGDRFPITRQR